MNLRGKENVTRSQPLVGTKATALTSVPPGNSKRPGTADRGTVRPGSDGSPVRRKTRNGGQAAAEDVVSQMERRMAELEGHLLTGCPNTVH